MGHINARMERVKSRSGKHASYANAFIVSREGAVRSAKILSKRPVRGTYSRGVSEEALLSPPSPGEALVLVRFTRGLRNRVGGVITVYDNEAQPVLRAVYRRLKVRRSAGDASYEWAVRAVMDHLKLPVKRYNMRTGSPSPPAPASP